MLVKTSYWPTGEQQLHKFANGYGASVIPNELAVIRWYGDRWVIAKHTGLFVNGVFKHPTPEDVENCLKQIEAL